MNMFKMQKSFIAIIILFAACLILNENAYAVNGTRELGFSARDSAMAGATTASPEDTSCLVKNPASLVWIGNRIDLNYQNILPHDVTMHTEGAISNAGLRQKSNIDYLPGGNAGISYRIPGTDKYPISVGFGVFTMAGLADNFPSSRILSALTGDYDKMMDLRSMRFAPGIAVAFNDKLSFGATGNLAIQALRSNLATSTLVGGRYPETAGGGKWDFTPGGGFTLGLLYKFHEMLNVGFTYESHQWMGYHDRYKDALHYIDEPPVISLGLAFKPIKDLEITYDTRYINWTDVKIAKAGPANGGFGWGDQWVFAVGGEYTYKEKLKFRMGYNYGKAPLQSHVAFANALLPAATMEHHFTTGISYAFTKRLSADLTWEHHFMGVKADNGCGDGYSVNGAGTKITAAAEIISIGLGYKF
ncbi:MAG: outer membrane protein transport protein [Candidatus Omnitrophica bacterium]|nr:outer membrane protein transport protein [Candidatus Omnitrophota bacterium]